MKTLQGVAIQAIDAKDAVGEMGLDHSMGVAPGEETLEGFRSEVGRLLGHNDRHWILESQDALARPGRYYPPRIRHIC